MLPITRTTFPAWTTPKDRYMDYVYRPYEPLASTEKKYRSENFLLLSAADSPELLALLKLLRTGFGRDRIVYGVKQRAGRLYWEFYVYTYDVPPDLTPKHLERLLRGWDLGTAVPERLEHCMFSFEIDAEALRARRLAGLHIYTLFSKGAQTFSRCHHLLGGSLRLENDYIPIPLDSPRNAALARAMVARILSGRDGVSSEQILVPSLMECRALCFARKRKPGRVIGDPNAIYFARLPLRGLIGFMKLFDYPAPLLAFAEKNRKRLDHLLFDVGFDFGLDGAIAYEKSGFYGLC